VLGGTAHRVHGSHRGIRKRQRHVRLRDALRYTRPKVQRRVLAALILATLVIGGIEPSYFRILLGDPTERLRKADRRLPGYPEFLEGVAARTRKGDSVVIVAPLPHWKTGYGYAYYRASYVLAGRNVIPILDDDDRVRRERLQQAGFVAVWRMPELPGYKTVWRGHGGALQRRAR